MGNIAHPTQVPLHSPQRAGDLAPPADRPARQGDPTLMPKQSLILPRMRVRHRISVGMADGEMAHPVRRFGPASPARQSRWLTHGPEQMHVQPPPPSKG